MGVMKEFDKRIRGGGDDAIAAVSELWESRENILFDITDAFTKARWIPVSERLPEPQKNVLLSSTARKCRIMRLIDGVSECYWADDAGLTASLAVYDYWMPLPEPPEVSG